MKALEKKEEITFKRSRWQEIIKLRSETNKIETNYKEPVKQRVGSLRKSIRSTSPYLNQVKHDERLSKLRKSEIKSREH